jgi:hypothetical protein
MKSLSGVTLALVVTAVGGMTNGATAAPITYNFTGIASDNRALGASQTYTVSGGPTVTAISGSYAQSGFGAPVAGDTFTAGGQLVGNNRGTDQMGVGVCFGSGCNRSIGDPEIDASDREAVRLDISSLRSAFGSFIVNADSATDGEVLAIFAGNATGNALGANLTWPIGGGVFEFSSGK